MKKIAWMVLLFAFAASVHAAAGDEKNAEPAKKNQWTPEDVVYQEDAGQFRISPDGKFALWVKGTADKDKDLRVGNLYLSNLSDGKVVQLTRGTDEISNPRWSPSGETIAFLSSHALPKPKPDTGSTQIWLMNSAGGEPWPVTESERGVKQFEWLNDDTILFSAEEDPSLYERQTKERKDDSNVVDDTAHTCAGAAVQVVSEGQENHAADGQRRLDPGFCGLARQDQSRGRGSPGTELCVGPENSSGHVYRESGDAAIARKSSRMSESIRTRSSGRAIIPAFTLSPHFPLTRAF